MGKLDELRAKFLKAYANLPEPEMELVIVIVKNKKISWNKANKEIEDKTELGNQILKKMKDLEIL